MDITWKYKIELQDESVFSEIEKERGIIIPENLKELIVKANAATPSKYNFMIGTVEKVLGAILSFNKNEKDTDTVYTALKVIENKKLFPFAIDPFGNYICYNIDENEVVFWDHESDTVSSADKNLEQFLESLY